MKIIGGRYKGLTIDTSKNLSYRPTQSRIRKSIFDIITPFTYSRVLDLYSGSGILGFESASRGADSITFVETNSNSIKMLKRNKSKFKGVEFFMVRKKAFYFLKSIENKYDLIFADPPYDKLDYTVLMSMCKEKLSKNGKLILEMSNNNLSFTNSIERKYGDTKIVIYTKQ